MIAEMSLDEQKSLFIRASQLYHNGTGTSPLTDEQFDDLKRQLRDAEPTWEPLNVAGWKPNDMSPLDKATHTGFMGSIFNAFDYAPAKTPDEDKWEVGFKAWLDKFSIASTWATLKVDGASVALDYRDGRLVMALTRGDCIEGENVTHHVVHMPDLPTFIPFKGHCVVRGEVVFTTSAWRKYLEANPDAKNARNMAAGILGRKEVGDSHYLKFFAHGLDILLRRPGDESPKTFEETHDWFKSQGFLTPNARLCETFNQCKDWYDQIANLRSKNALPYEIDGIVFSINDRKKYMAEGVDSGRCPRGAVAWKFPVMTARTTLGSVDWQVGHTGAISPVAILMPVLIGGVTVSRASLSNPEEIKRLDLRTGDVVEISRQGDTIPKVLRRISEDSRNDQSYTVVIPTKCPECEGKVGRKAKVDGEAGAVLYCLNPECSAQAMGKIHKWVVTTNMLGIGKNLIKCMIAAKLVENPADLYRLTTPELASMKFNDQTFGMIRAEKVITVIQSKRSMPLSMFLGGLGVLGLGERVVQNVQAKAPGQFDAVTDWIDTNKLVQMKDELSMPNIAEPIWNALQKRRTLVQHLLSVGVVIEAEQPTAARSEQASGPAAGMVFCLTGSFPEKKQVYYDLIQKAGGEFEEDVKSNVTHVVVESREGKATGKRKKAEDKGIPVLILPEFMTVLNGTAASQPAPLETEEEEEAGYPA